MAYEVRISDWSSDVCSADLDTIQEDDEFAGVHDGTATVDGILKLTGAGLFDDIPDFDEASSIDDFGGIVSEGTYYFASGIDLGVKIGRACCRDSLCQYV